MSDFRDVIALLHTIESQELLEDFLFGITTPKERAELAQRLEIVKRLLRGDAQSKIAKELGVGIATVTRGSKELANGRFQALRTEKS